MRQGLLLLAFALLALPSSRALACSGAFCTPARVAPPTGATIPSNAPALFIDPGFDGLQHVAGSTEVTLLDGTGASLPLDAIADSQFGLRTLYLLVPRAALASSSTYRLRFSPTCSDGTQDGPPPLVEQSFTTTSAVPLPATAGNLTIAQQRTQAVTAWTARGSCVRNLLASTAALAFQPADELKPWLPLARLTTTVDGNEWARSDYGADPTASATYRGVETIFAVCPPLDTADDNGLPLGAHHVELQVHIAGATTDPPPLSVDVNLTCPDPPTPPDAGSVAPGPKPSGCATGGDAPAMSLFLVLALLALRRRAGRLALLCLVALGMAACTSHDGGAGPQSLGDYQLAVAGAECHRKALCGEIGTLAEMDCVTETLSAAPGGEFSDEAAVAAGRATFDADAAKRCLAAYAALKSCMGDGAEPYALRGACQPPFRGQVPAGGACHAPYECADGYCDASAIGCEGHCKAWPSDGACPCRPSETCAGVDVGCRPLGGSGAACTATYDCKPGLVCLSHYTSTGPIGKCGTPLHAGAHCLEASNLDVACAGGLYCDGMSNTCKPLATDGENCNGEVGCAIGLVCNYREEPPWECMKPSDIGDPTARIGVPCTPGACGNSYLKTLYCADVCQPLAGIGKPCAPPAAGADNPCAVGACDPVTQVCVATCS